MVFRVFVPSVLSFCHKSAVAEFTISPEVVESKREF